jgi:outer membrane protein assembly factor BamB
MLLRFSALPMLLWLSFSFLSGGLMALPPSDAPEGLIVVVGVENPRELLEKAKGEKNLFLMLDSDPALVDEMNQAILETGRSDRVTAAVFDGKHLPLVDQIANRVILQEQFDIPDAELDRVLAPYGEIYEKGGTGWKKQQKPYPKAYDHWTHYLYDATNNAVAKDSAVGPPRHMQWLGGPEWTRNHHKLNSISSVVTDRGRIFMILDQAPASNITLPGRWVVVARDAFSGVTLWKKPIDSWASHRHRFRSGPAQLPRLMVADGDRLYLPLGLNAPIAELDAATGETLRTFPETEGVEEIVVSDGQLLALTGDPVAEQTAGHPDFKGLFKMGNRKAITAVDLATGQSSWKWSPADANLLPETLAADDKSVFIQADEGVVCLDRKNGRKRWDYYESDKKLNRTKVHFGVNTLIVAEDVVLAKLAGKLVAVSANDGKKLWESWAGAGFHAPVDVFVIDGVVWQGHHPSDSISPPPVKDFSEGRDLHTGEVVATNVVAVDLQTAGHHHRCYREKATERFILMGKRGIEMLDLRGQQHSRNNWVRGTCQYGILPANGMIYVPPHSCGCYMESKLRGFWALTPESRVVDDRAFRLEETDRLERGPAFGARENSLESTGQWPTFRHDPLRSSVASTEVSSDLSPGWTTSVGGPLIQPVVAHGKVLVARKDAGVVVALDQETGKPLWRHVAGGRIDSPPTIHQSRVLFGSADGRVTCLSLDDGRLQWRFLAAPADLRAVSYNQLESLWPVHGSVLVLDGVAYVSAGRSSWLDEGITLYGLDPKTGKVLHEHRFRSEHPEYRGKVAEKDESHKIVISQNETDYKTFLQSDRSDAFSMAAGTVSDVLVSDGENVYLHQAKFSPELERSEKLSRHLFATSSLLDDNENHRSHWVLGTGDFSRIPVAYSWIANRPGRWQPNIAVPVGVMMVFDETAVWGVRRKGDSNGKYQLFERENRPFDPSEPSKPDFRKTTKEETAPVWTQDWNVRTTAMLKANDLLFLATTPSHATVFQTKPDDAAPSGTLAICSAEDGTPVAEHALPAPAEWDGMSAAEGTIFLSLSDGTVHCMVPKGGK